MRCIERKLALMLLLKLRNKKRKRKHRFWERSIIKARSEKGEFNLFLEMHANDHELFHHSFRMSPSKFDYLVERLGPSIQKSNEGRPSISVKERLAVTLRFLSTGDAQQTISHSYRLGKTTVFNIIYETCDAIWDVMGGELIKTPTQSDDWCDIAQDFENLWNFPHCLGALDGKHVVIESPANSGTEYYNYKGTFSIVLLAMCDAKYCFTMIDVGASGRESDGGVFAESKFGKLLDSDSLGVPRANKITDSSVNVPYVIVADAAFPLKTYLLKPYPGKQLCVMQDVFNYRLSRARRIIENAFGILCNRWRIFRRVISAKPDNAVRIVKAACVLHNYLQQNDNNAAVQERQYCPPGYVDTYDSDGVLIPGKWREDGVSVGFVAGSSQRPNGTSNKHGRAAAEVRNAFANYFVSSVGEIEWQYRRVLGTGPTK